LLRIVGILWAAFGVISIMNSPSMTSKNHVSPEISGFVLLFNIILFIGPGLLLAGVGSIIKKKVAEKKCPVCAEMIKPDAKKCRFCNAEL
jgi:hypothetical protein